MESMGSFHGYFVNAEYDATNWSRLSTLSTSWKSSVYYFRYFIHFIVLCGRPVYTHALFRPNKCFLLQLAGGHSSINGATKKSLFRAKEGILTNDIWEAPWNPCFIGIDSAELVKFSEHDMSKSTTYSYVDSLFYHYRLKRNHLLQRI